MITQAKPRERVDQKYNFFEGRYREQMPLLISQGYQPLTIGGIMQGRLEETLSYDTYYDTSTGIFHAGNDQDKFKILPYSEALIRVNKTTHLYVAGIERPEEDYGGIEKTEEDYKQIEAREFSRKDMILNQWLTEEEASEHQGWLALANNNQALLQEYIQSTFKLFKDRCRADKAMTFYIRNPQEVPILRAVCLHGLNDGSGASGRVRLFDNARLVGVSEKKSAEGTLAGKRQIFL